MNFASYSKLCTMHPYKHTKNSLIIYDHIATHVHTCKHTYTNISYGPKQFQNVNYLPYSFEVYSHVRLVPNMDCYMCILAGRNFDTSNVDNVTLLVIVVKHDDVMCVENAHKICKFSKGW